MPISSLLNPRATTIGDLITQALKDAGVLGVGQTALAEDVNDAWARVQWMLQQWQQERWMIYHLVTFICDSTFQTIPYSVGPGGQFDTNSAGENNPAFGSATFYGSINGSTLTTTEVLSGTIAIGQTLTDFGNFVAPSTTISAVGGAPNTWTLSQAQPNPIALEAMSSVFAEWTPSTPLTIRPDQIEYAFFQQNTTGGGNLSPIVYPLRLYRAQEDYRKIALPTLNTFPLAAYYDPSYPLGQLYFWPWPNNPQYSMGIVIREQLPAQFPSLTTVVYLPPVYYQAIVSNLAMALRPKYGIGTFPGDLLPIAAKRGRDVIRKGSTQIANLQMPSDLVRNGNYNIFSDQSY